jgi:glycosyl transferase family 21
MLTDLSYVLPIRTVDGAGDEFFEYLQWLSSRVELILVDGSPRSVFDLHARRCGPGIIHAAVDADLSGFQNGKVAGVITGLRRASHEAVVVADDDVRYDAAALRTMAEQLTTAHVVRPQNYFDPMPWHGALDTSRTLLNRVTGGDWPGTLGVRRSVLLGAGGYDGDVLFENLEMIRTVVAAGGIEATRLDLYVRRLPPTTAHFWSQRVRQAYDEFARPLRLIAWAAVAPAAIVLATVGRWTWLVAAIPAVMAAAEIGRRRAHGRRVFPAAAVFAAPLWVIERAVCTWLALAAYVLRGGVRYRGRTIARAATPLRHLRARFRNANVLAGS